MTTLTPRPQCVELGCIEPPTQTVTVLVGYDPDLGSIPGNGRLVFFEFCDDCAEAEKQELVLSASDDAQFVCAIPHALTPGSRADQ